MKKTFILGMLTFLSLISPVQADTPRILKVGFTPWENQEDMLKNSQLIVDQMSKALHMRVVPFVATDYSGVIEAMRSKKIDLAFFPPAAYVMAQKQAHAKVILKSKFNGVALYHSAIITHRNSPIKKLSDLKGKTFAFVDPASTSGCIIPKVMLMNAKLNPERDFSRLIYAGGHDAVVLSVLNRQVDAGATYANNKNGYNAWNKMLKPSERKMIRVISYSQPIPSDNMCVRADLDANLINRIKKFYLDLSATEHGRKDIRRMYKVDGFTAASDKDYAPIREAFGKVGLKMR